MDFGALEIPSYEEVSAELEDLSSHLYKVLDAATHKAYEFFLLDGKGLDVYLYPPLVRFYAKRDLQEKAQSIACKVEDLENNGLSLLYQRYHIKILKSNNGCLPPAGPSRIRQLFYRQGRLWPLDQISTAAPHGEKRRPVLNLVILWDTDPATKMLHLKLTCPKYGSPSTAIEHWIHDIQHPAYFLEDEGESLAYPVDMDDDLGIAILEEGTAGGMHSAS